MFYQVWDFINNPVFSINTVPVSIFKLFMTILIFISGFVLGALYKRKMKSLQLNQKSFTQSTRTLLTNIGYYIIILIAFFVALNVLGVKLSSIALVAGALSVGIGFGLQNIVSNFVSGLILMFERSVKIGDYIQLDGDLRGHVTDIRMRSTTINTNENIDIIIPNQKLIENNVINWTMNDKLRRFEINFDVAYGTDARKVIGLIKEAVKESGFGDIYTSSSRYTRVLMTGLGDSSVNFQLFIWIQGGEIYYPKRTTSRFLILIYETLNANGIEIPFPQSDLHIRSIEDNLIISQIDNNSK
jgi:small-conductance mechanosensitive channel